MLWNRILTELGGRHSSHQTFTISPKKKIHKLKRLAQHDKRKSPSVMWRISFPNKLRNEHTTTKQLEQ